MGQVLSLLDGPYLPLLILKDNHFGSFLALIKHLLHTPLVLLLHKDRAERVHLLRWQLAHLLLILILLLLLLNNHSPHFLLEHVHLPLQVLLLLHYLGIVCGGFAMGAVLMRLFG
jgi:hypothetical protein